MRWSALGLVALTACDSIPKADAVAFLAKIEAIASASPPQDMHTMLMMVACSEVPSCGGACSEAFGTAPQYAEADQRRIIAGCSNDYREASSGPAKLSLGTWLRRYIGHYVVKARKQLDNGAQARLDAAIEKLGH